MVPGQLSWVQSIVVHVAARHGGLDNSEPPATKLKAVGDEELTDGKKGGDIRLHREPVSNTSPIIFVCQLGEEEENSEYQISEGCKSGASETV